jgi:hypothetical protein
LRFSGSPTQLTKEGRSWRVRSKQLVEHILRPNSEKSNYLVGVVRYEQCIYTTIHRPIRVPPKAQSVFVNPSVFWVGKFEADIHGIAIMGDLILDQ